MNNIVSRIRIDEGKMTLIFDCKEISYIHFKKPSATCGFKNGKEIIINTPFSKLKELLPMDQFILIDDVIILNRKEIKSINNHDIESEIILKSGKSIYLGLEKKKLFAHFSVIK